MACTSMAIPGATTAVSTAAAAKDAIRDGLRRSDSGGDLVRCGLRRSRSEPHIRCALSAPRAAGPGKMKSSRSVGMMLPFGLNGSILPSSLRSFLFDDSEDGQAMTALVGPDGEDEGGGAIKETEKRANWVDRILELRGRWRERKNREEEEEEETGGDHYCEVGYDSEEEERGEVEWDQESFSRFLAEVPWSEMKLFSQLAFLCNMAYVIPEIKAEDLRTCYDLLLVTSSLEKKSEAAVKARLDTDSTRPPPPLPAATTTDPPQIGSGSELPELRRQSVAYEIAASAASYVQSRAKGLLSLGSDPHPDESAAQPPGERVEAGLTGSEVAAFVAASTMTAVVAAEEDARQQAARDLQSLHSCPCEWFVCDDPHTYTRCFVIQGSDSLASWQANLFFEPTKFEGMEVLVHRGIYEAAKGIYKQFMPEIEAHLKAHGNRARLRFTGHSLGGSLSLLVHLMLMIRGVVPRSALLPVVTFGSPAIFCGGRRVLEELGLDDGHVQSVMMHRDIVPRAFSCNYPNHVAQLLKRLNGSFRSHPCLNNQKLLYTPLGKLFILQPDDKSSPPHPLLPAGAALYTLNCTTESSGSLASALRAFLNSPHPLETLSDPTAYGSEGTILRDHDSSNYLKAVNGLVRHHTKSFFRKSRRHRLELLWPLLTTATGLSGRSWNHETSLENSAGMAAKEMLTGC